MYSPPKFLTMQVMSEIASEFEWPAPYTLEDWSPDGIVMMFPRCNLCFTEGFESDMDLEFLPGDTGVEEALTLTDALIAIRYDPERTTEMADPKLIGDHTPHATLDKVKNGIRDLCTLMLAHLPSCVLGDFSWVEKYKAYRARSQGAATESRG